MYSGPRYASETSYYKKRKNEQDDVNNNEKLVKKFIEDIFPEFFGGQLSWGKFSGGIFPDTRFIELIMLFTYC